MRRRTPEAGMRFYLVWVVLSCAACFDMCNTDVDVAMSVTVTQVPERCSMSVSTRNARTRMDGLHCPHAAEGCSPSVCRDM
jgi:hypothetical protein